MSEKKISQLSDGEKTQLVVDALSKAGYNANQIAVLTGLSRQHTGRLKKKIEGGALDNLRVKARKTVEKILTNKLTHEVKRTIKNPDGSETEVSEVVPYDVSPSEMLRAAGMVLDRTDPATHKVEQNVAHHHTGQITVSDREKYLRALGVQPKPELPAPEVPEADFTPVEETDESDVQTLQAPDGETGHEAS